MYADPLGKKIVRILPCAGVAVALGELDSHRGFDYFSAADSGKGPRSGGRMRDEVIRYLVCDHVDSNAAGHGDHSRDVGRYLFD